MFDYLKNVRLKTISYGLIIFMLVAGGIVATASFSTLREVSDARTAWQDFDTGSGRKTRIMADIRDAFGFGGLIHNFKNTVIRRDLEYVQRAKEKAADAQAAIDEYRKQDLSPEEVSALSVIASSVNDYAAQIPELERLVRNGATVEGRKTMPE